MCKTYSHFGGHFFLISNFHSISFVEGYPMSDYSSVMVNKCIKFHEDILNYKKVMAKVKVCHANADTYDADTPVMTIP